MFRILLVALSTFSFVFGFYILVNSKSAIHEIESLLCFLIFAIFLTGGILSEEIQKFKEDNSSENKNLLYFFFKHK